ncbi:MAG TPA: hypothetical protein VGQ46_05455 [Thermoanaerobaculia bacterium]|jgi:hypothetical protein|nr:hypothetical protein [Thermoanaerobaculia bacterium]
MDVEIVFTGLCSFLNVNGQNETMTEPSVIIVRTDDHAGHDMPGMDLSSVSSSTSVTGSGPPTSDAAAGANPPHAAGSHEHIPYIAFDTTNATLVDDATGAEPADLAPVVDAPNGRFLRLAGAAPLPEAVLIGIEGDTPGKPTVDPSYAKVVMKDKYWPQAKDQWNRDFVPEPAKNGISNKPSKSAVVAFLRFGQGKIYADRICPFFWHFDIPGGGSLEDNFAEEVIYSGFTHPGDDVVITLKTLDTEDLVRTLRFSPKVAGQAKLTIFIGNNVEGDMDNSINRLPPSSINPTGHHFAFLNQVAAASLKTSGPIPTAGAVPGKPPLPPGGGGGGIGGVCGPQNAGGPPPP